MIFDGQWKRELKTLSREIAFWQKMSFVSGYAEHRLNRAVLYSATVLRKVIEDEVEAESIAKKTNISLPKQKTLHASLEAISIRMLVKKAGRFAVNCVPRIMEKAKIFA